MDKSSRLWDEAAATFDEEADHGLGLPGVLAAWTGLLEKWLPPAPAEVLDIGCGTGSLSVVMAGLNYQVTAVDFSRAMLERAREKTAENEFTIPFLLMDAAQPAFQGGTFDVLLCRHLLWALPEPDRVLERWAKLLRAKGRVILIEGFWDTGSGLHSQDIIAALPDMMSPLAIEELSSNPEYWGKRVADERYAIILEKRS